MDFLSEKWEQQSIHFSYLDELCQDYLWSIGAFEPSAQLGSPSRMNQFQSEIKQFQEIRQQIIEGKIQQTIDYLQKYQPEIFQNSKLLFRFYRQQFIELLRNGSHLEAIKYAKEIFGPFALNAYPEAYVEFKSTMLLLIYTHSPNSPVNDAWNVHYLEELADSLYSTLIFSRKCVDSCRLRILFRYLTTIHNIYHKEKDTHSSFPELQQIIQQIHLKPFPKEIISSDGLDKRFVYSLSQVLQPYYNSSEDAINSLKYTNGNVQEALLNELTRIDLNDMKLTDWVLEYCQYRGIVIAENLSAEFKNQCLDSSSQNTVEKLKKVRKLTKEGKIREVIQETSLLKSSFWNEAPHLYFELKQCEFFDLLKQEKYEDAITLVRKELTPITIQNPELTPLLKKSVVYLAAPQTAHNIQTQNESANLAGALYSSLGSSLGLPEPKLVKLFKYLLSIHNSWFLFSQRCEDIFEQYLKIDELKSPEHPSISDKEEQTTETQQQDESSSQMQEGSVIKLMELMNFSRTEAVELLSSYNGNLDNILADFLEQ